MKFYKKSEAWGLWQKEKNMLHSEKKKKKMVAVRNADARIGVQRNNHCTSELCVFKIESSFYIITYNS